MNKYSHVRKRTFYAILLSSVMALFLSACGSSGSPTPPAPPKNPTLIRGLVTDPAIVNARVHVIDKNGTAISRVVLSQGDGSFSLQVAHGFNLEGAFIFATFGQDTQTGYSFRGLTLKAVYDAAAARIIVSPASTMVVEAMEADADLTLGEARGYIAGRLGLEEDLLDDDPASNLGLQRRSLQLTKLAVALRAAGGFDYAYDLVKEHKTDWAAIGAAPNMPADVQDIVAELILLDAIDQNLSAADFIEQANKQSLLISIRQYLKDAYTYEPEAGATGDINTIALVDALWKANGKKGVPTGSPNTVNVARYALNKYEIDMAVLDADWEVPAAIAEDTLVPSIMGLGAINHKIALGGDEVLANDSAKRLAYYHQSDLSPNYRAQQLVKNVLDDNIADPIYLNIARGLSDLGFKEDADVYLETQIFQPYWRASAYRSVGYGLLEQGKNAESEQYLDKALTILNAHFEAVGRTLDSDIAGLFRAISETYSSLGLTSKADNALKPVTDYILEQAQPGREYSDTYVRLAIGFRNLADDKVDVAEAANLSEATVADALTSIQFFEQLTDGVGYQTSSRVSCGNFYKMKAYLYTSVAGFYKRINKPDETYAALQKFVNLRAVHPCTSEVSDVYVSFIADEYGYLKKVDEFKTMVNNTVVKQRYKDRALSGLAKYEALALAEEGKVNEAIAYIENATPDATDDDFEDRMRMYTNLGVNRLNKGVGLTLLEAGNIAAGEKIINKAFELSTSDAYINMFATDGNQMMRYGCAKVALLTHEFVDAAKGIQQMQTCLNVAEGYEQIGTTDSIHVSYRYLSEAMFKIQQTVKGVAAFEKSLAYASQLQTNEEYLDALRRTMLYVLEAGAIEQGLSVAGLISSMDDAEGRYALDPDYYQARALAASYNDIVGGLRNRIVATGDIPEDLAVTTDSLRLRVKTVLEKSLPLIRDISSSSSRKRAYEYLLEQLYRAYAFDAAEVILADESTDKLKATDANKFRRTLALKIMRQNDYLNSDVARFDFDGDGKADFYEAGYTEAEIAASNIQLDDDIDNDGVLDVFDTTPYCATCN